MTQIYHTNVTSLDSDCILGSGWAIWKLFNGMCRVLWLIVKTLQVWKRKIRVLRKNHLAHWLGHILRFGFWPVQLCKSLDVNRACLHVTEHASQLGGHEAIFINTTTSMTFLFWLLWATFYSICNAEKIRRDFFSFLPPSNKSLVSRKELSFEFGFFFFFFTVNVSAQIVLIGGRFPLSAGHVLLGDAEPQHCRPGSFQRHSGVTKRAMFFRWLF